MNIKTQHQLGKTLLLFALISVLMACSNDSSSDAPETITSMHISDQDECHLCGMLIQGFPGPKGSIQDGKSSIVKKFCSSNDLFAYLLQPENIHLVKHAYTHDMAQAEWHKPNDDAFVPVQNAWYVIEHQLRGAMGPTIASFASHESAQHFVQEHQGHIIRFEDISLELLNRLSHMMHAMDAAYHN